MTMPARRWKPLPVEEVFMLGLTTADWLFIAAVMLVIFVCVAFSDMRRKK
jgi:disulfide bond formation protein DsbB